ncbi:MAG: hypothetical protein DRR16_24035 [Candidatus Parabeggiatoa sp. nov. 3]|nr:MAG: hypothetical protein DRQ99_33230 [Gammaproteobacteria bacterium]RKZ80335.1 MAG: hypothetical protein DRR16_24035 [Gammaproteobacteria bacterium]HEW98674.1 hypothetical protein [Beggiatoa sp.]
MLRYITILFSLIILMGSPAHATRIALVIGNGDYDKRLNQLGLESLDNPVNDARDMAAVLESLGFEVILKTNLRKKKAMKQAVRHFARRLKRGGKVGVFYFSGHGFQHNNVNYLVPLRADLHSRHDIEDEALSAKYVLNWMESSHQGVNVMILDACRNSILDEFLRKSKGAFAGVSKGFSSMSAPIGTLIAYATAPNTTSWGGLPHERNSVYTKHLLKELRQNAHVRISDLFMAVRKRVIVETKTAPELQVPWELNSLTQGFCFGQCEQNGLSSLLQQCKNYLQANYLTVSPTGNTAFSCYQQVLQQDSGNRQALIGLNEIAAKYVGFTERALNRGNHHKAQQYLARLRKVNAEHPKLASLEAQLQEPKQGPAGKVFRDRLKDGSLGPEMVWIPEGRFKMGDIQGGGYFNEKPVHWVSVKKFAMGRYEITFAEYDKFAKATSRKKPSDQGWGRGNRPVINVSWLDVTAYAKWLSKQTGQQYRLPTEAQWEYAARAGTKTKYWWGNDLGKNRAACDGCGAKWGWDAKHMTAPVGSFAANPFGLYDTAGNVWEWTCSEYENRYKGKEMKCLSNNRANDNSLFVLRGGSWLSDAVRMRSVDRGRSRRAVRFRYGGARLSRM